MSTITVQSVFVDSIFTYDNLDQEQVEVKAQKLFNAYLEKKPVYLGEYVLGEYVVSEYSEASAAFHTKYEVISGVETLAALALVYKAVALALPKRFKADAERMRAHIEVALGGVDSEVLGYFVFKLKGLKEVELVEFNFAMKRSGLTRTYLGNFGEGEAVLVF